MNFFKLNSKEKCLFLSPVLLLIGVVSLRAWGTGDKLDRAQRKLAGPTAIDCGIGLSKLAENNFIGGHREKVDECAVKAFKAGKPFRARYDNLNDEGTDDEAIDSWGTVRTPEGKCYFFYYRYPSYTIGSQYDYAQAECPDPKIISRSGNSGKREVVGCGTCADLGSMDDANCLLHP